MINAREFYDAAPIGVCILRHSHQKLNILYLNEASLRMIFCPETEEELTELLKGSERFVGKCLPEIWPSQRMQELIKNLKGIDPSDEFILPIRDDTSIQQNWVKMTVRQGEFEGEKCFILWATDISANKEAEERLHKAVEEADAAATMKANFLATMSHEIRTPMQSIYGLLELIGEDNIDVKIRSMVDTAKTSSSGLLEILDDILDLAKIEANKMELNMFEVPVRTLIGGINEAMAVRIQGKDIVMKVDVEDDVPFVIVGDPTRLRQILINLAGNSIKFTEEGSITTRVSLKTQKISQPKRGVALRFEIIDTGIGVKKDVLPHLFQPFSQADSSTSRKFGGTGLGLSICGSLIEMMGGEIGVESTEGEGSTFWFEIPTEEVSTKMNTLELPNLDGISVLAVDDHPQGGQEIVRSLEHMGAMVDLCTTYKEALDLAKHRPFDVGVIDQGLPDGLGIDLLQKISEIRPAMGMVMYTVRNDAGLQYSLQTMGVKYISKPASRLGLGEAVLDSVQRTSPVNFDGPTRLLVAEDTPSVRDILKRQFAKIGVDVDFAENGIEALKAIDTGKYGILITDLHMPEMDGYEVIATIRDRENKIADNQEKQHRVSQRFPVIALTADVQLSQRQTYMEYGFDESLIKPVSLGQLRRLLVRWGLLSEEEAEEEEGKTISEPAETVSEEETKDSVQAAVNRASIIELMGDIDENTVEMLHMFIDMCESTVENIEEAMEHNDYQGVREAAHSLKGASRSASCDILGDICEKLQDDADSKKESCKEIVPLVRDEFERARIEIDNFQIRT